MRFRAGIAWAFSETDDFQSAAVFLPVRLQSKSRLLSGNACNFDVGASCDVHIPAHGIRIRADGIAPFAGEAIALFAVVRGGRSIRLRHSLQHTGRKELQSRA
jgi:hypothetical protein